MIDIKKSQFQVEAYKKDKKGNIIFNNGLRNMNGDVAFEIMSDEARKAIEAGTIDFYDKNYHFVLVSGTDKVEAPVKKEEPKTDIMRKNKKVID